MPRKQAVPLCVCDPRNKIGEDVTLTTLIGRDLRLCVVGVKEEKKSFLSSFFPTVQDLEYNWEGKTTVLLKENLGF